MLVMCLILVLSGCKAWTTTKKLPRTVFDGASDALTKIVEAAEQDCAWRRIKIVEGAEFNLATNEPGALDEWIVNNLANKEYVSDTPASLKAYIREILDATYILQEFAPSKFASRVAIENANDKQWNNEVLYALGKDGKITFTAQGPGNVVIFSMLSVSRDTALTNVRKYVYSITSDNGVVDKVPTHTTRITGMWLRHTTVWSGSEPYARVIKVPQGTHTYTVEYVFSGEGDILLKFLEAQQD